MPFVYFQLVLMQIQAWLFLTLDPYSSYPYLHAMQVLQEELSWTHHDVFVGYVATPEEVIHCSREMPRPTGIYWEDLNESKISKIPVLQ